MDSVDLQALAAARRWAREGRRFALVALREALRSPAFYVGAAPDTVACADRVSRLPDSPGRWL